MPFDAVFLKSMLTEINEVCLGGKVDKINMPERDRIVITVRTLGKNVKLLLCANANHPRVQMTDVVYDNPDVPPMFCMLLRKHISGGKIMSITQLSFERAIKFSFSVTNEFLEKETKSLVLEILGRQSNIILLDSEDRIIDSLKKVSFNEHASRQVMPGAKYKLPDSMNKLNPFLCEDAIREKIFADKSSLTADKLLMAYVMGLSPLISREIAFKADVLDVTACELSCEQKENLLDTLFSFLNSEKSANMLVGDKGPKDYSVCNIEQYGNKYQCRTYDSFSNLLDEYFSADERREILKTKSAEISRYINSTVEKISKKLVNQHEELAESKDREKYRIYGELITANINSIEKGASKCSLVNYYDENLAKLEVPLDPKISAAKNAQRYFKKYQKLKTAEEMLGSQIKNGKAELEYFEKLSALLELVQSPEEIDDIKNELIELGYLKRPSGAKKKQKPSQPHHFVSKNGFDIYVGRNNLQNDYLTHKFAAKNDYWLHALNLTGSHVILVANGKEVPDDDIVEAAEYAAYFSSGRGEEKVPVTYTPAKFVKKPNGAKPGFVIYSTSYTVYVSGNAKNQIT